LGRTVHEKNHPGTKRPYTLNDKQFYWFLNSTVSYCPKFNTAQIALGQ